MIADSTGNASGAQVVLEQTVYGIAGPDGELLKAWKMPTLGAIRGLEKYPLTVICKVTARCLAQFPEGSRQVALGWDNRARGAVRRPENWRVNESGKLERAR